MPLVDKVHDNYQRYFELTFWATALKLKRIMALLTYRKRAGTVSKRGTNTVHPEGRLPEAMGACLPTLGGASLSK
jgi:hypothetical protein